MKAIQIAIIIFLGGIFLASCGKDAARNEPEVILEEVSEEAVQDSSQAEVSPVMEKPELFGTIEVPPAYVYQQYSKVSAYVNEIPVLPGQKVSKGTLLLSLDSPEFLRMQEELLVAKADYVLQKSNFDRKQGLKAQNNISDREFQETENAFEVAKARYRGQHAALKAMGFDVDSIEKGEFQQALRIYSPVAGVLSSLHVTKGQRVDENTHLLTLIDPSHIHVEIMLPGSKLGQVQSGDAFVMHRTNSSKTIAGEIKLVNAVMEEGQNNVRLHGHLEGNAKDWEGLVIGERVLVEMK